MREDSFFVLKENIEKDILYLTGGEFLHLSRVLRHRVGDKVKCFYDGSDVFICEIKDILKDRAVLKILESTPCLANPKKQITLFQGVPKLDKLELIAQKLCEVGVSNIVPFESIFSEMKLSLHKIDRINKIIISACKQCKRTSLLKLEQVIKLKDINLTGFDLVIFANEKEKENSICNLEKEIKRSQKIAYIIGSEGGFSQKEIEELRKKALSISLGSRILRTETASIVLGGLIAIEGEV